LIGGCPCDVTLHKYGLTRDDWNELASRQDYACYVCRKLPKSGRLCIDHEHVRGWKKMPPEKRKIYVRGLLCWFCNRTYVGRSITVEKSKRVTKYLEEHETRRVWAPASSRVVSL
jgi:hypothetical protein